MSFAFAGHARQHSFENWFVENSPKIFAIFTRKSKRSPFQGSHDQSSTSTCCYQTKPCKILPVLTWFLLANKALFRIFSHSRFLQAWYFSVIAMVVNFPTINLRVPGADFPSSCTSVEEHLLPSQRNQNSGLHLPVFWTAQSLFGFTIPIWIISFFATNRKIKSPFIHGRCGLNL